MGVDRAYRHHYVAGADIELGHKRFLNPELFESYLSATLYLLLEFANLLLLQLYSAFSAAVLELYFRAHAPSSAEVESDHEHHVGQVDAPVSPGVAVVGGMAVAVHIVGIEIMGIGHFSIASEREAREQRSLGLHTVGYGLMGRGWSRIRQQQGEGEKHAGGAHSIVFHFVCRLSKSMFEFNFYSLEEDFLR